jgi:hypothetical protein
LCERVKSGEREREGIGAERNGRRGRGERGRARASGAGCVRLAAAGGRASAARVCCRRRACAAARTWMLVPPPPLFLLLPLFLFCYSSCNVHKHPRRRRQGLAGRNGFETFRAKVSPRFLRYFRGIEKREELRVEGSHGPPCATKAPAARRRRLPPPPRRPPRP